jgi:hypothetical protein
VPPQLGSVTVCHRSSAASRRAIAAQRAIIAWHAIAARRPHGVPSRLGSLTACHRSSAGHRSSAASRFAIVARQRHSGPSQLSSLTAAAGSATEAAPAPPLGKPVRAPKAPSKGLRRPRRERQRRQARPKRLRAASTASSKRAAASAAPAESEPTTDGRAPAAGRTCLRKRPKPAAPRPGFYTKDTSNNCSNTGCQSDQFGGSTRAPSAATCSCPHVASAARRLDDRASAPQPPHHRVSTPRLQPMASPSHAHTATRTHEAAPAPPARHTPYPTSFPCQACLHQS